MIVLDIDGVIFDTEEVVQTAYREAGAEVPAGHWGKPWSTWLIDAVGGDEEKARKVHEAKTEIYLANIDKVKPLPPAKLFLDERIAVGGIRMITAANYRATRALFEHFGLDWRWLGGAELTAAGKADKLVETDTAMFGPHIYIDDHEEMLGTIQSLACPRLTEAWAFHRYTGEDYDSLFDLINSAGAI